MRTPDPEFMDVAKGKTGQATHPAQLIRGLIYAHAGAALLTASSSILYVAHYHEIIETVPPWGADPGPLGLLTFWTSFVFPPSVWMAANRAGFQGWEFRTPVLATFALGAFQWYAFLPAVQ